MDMASVVTFAFDSYTKLMQTITAEIPLTDPVIHKYVLQAMARIPKGYSFMHSGLHKILSGAKIRYEINDSKISASILIPVIKEDSILYLFHSKPLPYNTSLGIPVMPYFEMPFLAVTADKRLFAMLNSDDLLPCTHKDTYVCNTLQLYQSTSSASCLYDHFLGDALTAAKHCQYIKLTTSVYRITSDHKLHYFAKYPTSARFHCSGDLHQHPSSKPLLQLGSLEVPSGCSVSVDGFEGRNPTLSNQHTLPESAKPIVTLQDQILNLPETTTFLDQLRMQVIPQSIRLERTNFHHSVEFQVVLLGSILLSLVISCVCLSLIRLRLLKNSSSVNVQLTSSQTVPKSPECKNTTSQHPVHSSSDVNLQPHFTPTGEKLKMVKDLYVTVDNKGKLKSTPKDLIPLNDLVKE